MSSDAILFFQQIPSLIWSLFTSFRIPGVNFTPAVLVFGLLSFRVLIWAFINVFGLGSDALTNMFTPSETTTHSVSNSWRDHDGKHTVTRSKRVK